jgi:ABC-type sulfate/molybdate transport systems ATPase subunit
MALAFRRVTSGPLQGFEATAPDGVVIGIVGENGSGAERLLSLACGDETPASGSVERSGSVRRLGPGDKPDYSAVPVLLLDHSLAQQDALAREQAALALDKLRRGGTTTLLVSHEEELLRRLADEVWWLQEGKLAGRGDPAEVLTAYRRHTANRLRAWAESEKVALQPKWRRGDGRAEILSIQTFGENGQATLVWRSGELAVVKIRVKFHAAVADPVVGIMIRTRIGLNVYGTNTELEKLQLGPCNAGDVKDLSFAFRCELCPENYTLTVASHDPDGVWHDWLEDAVSFAVGDDRYTAGVANLRARATLS